jgi:hypothetical protein
MPYEIRCAIAGIFIIFGILALFLIPGCSELLVIVTEWSVLAGIVMFLAMAFLWGVALSAIFFLPFKRLDDKSLPPSSKEALSRIKSALVFGWFVAFFCMAAVEHTDFRGNLFILQFFTTWLFAGAFCLLQEMPRFKVEGRIRLIFT